MCVEQRCTSTNKLKNVIRIFLMERTNQVLVEEHDLAFIKPWIQPQ